MSETPFMTTERFELWRPRATDLEGHCRLLADNETRRFLGPASPEPQAQWERLMRNAGSWSLYGYGTLAVRCPGDDQIIATCGVFHSYRGLGYGMDDQPEAGWIVRQDWWGQRVAGEAMRAVIDWFDRTHGQRRIVCMIEEGHTGSEKVAAGLGFLRYDTMIGEEGRVALNFYERVRG